MGERNTVAFHQDGINCQRRKESEAYKGKYRRKNSEMFTEGNECRCKTGYIRNDKRQPENLFFERIQFIDM